MGALVLAQTATPDPVKSQEDFLGWQTVLLCVIPCIVVLILAKTRKQKEPELPHVDDSSFEDEVLRSELPVLVHFYRTWSIGDRVMINQARRLAERNGPRLKVVWLDVDKSPETVARFPHVETPAFLFFHDGRCLFHGEGVVDEADVDREMWEAHRKYLKRASG